jgi:hypothetical protein
MARSSAVKKPPDPNRDRIIHQALKRAGEDFRLKPWSRAVGLRQRRADFGGERTGTCRMMAATEEIAMRPTKSIALLLVFFASNSMAGSVPNGLELIFKNVESGQRFHPFWPPVSGHQILGTVVIAKNPGRPQAFFQTIDSPSYRNPAYTKEFIVGALRLDAPDLTSERRISAGVAFSQLDLIGKAISSTSSPQSLQGNSGASAPTCPTTAAAKSGSGSSGQTTTQAASGTNPPSNGRPTVANAVAGALGGQAAASGTSSPSGGSAAQKVTGVEFCRFTSATSKVTGLKVIYYDLPTLNDINANNEPAPGLNDIVPSGVRGNAPNANNALTPAAERLLSRGAKGWIIHRALVVDSIEYTLTSNSAIDAGFFAKLVAWLPTVAVGYRNQNTVTLKTTSPLTIGYKLWQRGAGVEGKAIRTIRTSTKEDLPGLEIGDDAIDELLFKRGR